MTVEDTPVVPDFALEQIAHLNEAYSRVERRLIGRNTDGQEAIKRSIQSMQGGAVDFSLVGVSLTAKDVDIVVQAIRQGKNLQRLTLKEVGLVDKGVASLVSVISTHPSLKQVNLDDNQFSKMGIRALCTLIAKNTDLQVLSLTHNNIGPSDILLIVEALQWNDKLEQLILCHNNIGDEGVKVIINVLNNNKAGTNLAVTMSRNKISDAGVAMVADWIASGSCTLDTIHIEGNLKVTKLGEEYVINRVKGSNYSSDSADKPLVLRRQFKFGSNNNSAASNNNAGSNNNSGTSSNTNKSSSISFSNSSKSNRTNTSSSSSAGSSAGSSANSSALSLSEDGNYWSFCG